VQSSFGAKGGLVGVDALKLSGVFIAFMKQIRLVGFISKPQNLTVTLLLQNAPRSPEEINISPVITDAYHCRDFYGKKAQFQSLKWFLLLNIIRPSRSLKPNNVDGLTAIERLAGHHKQDMQLFLQEVCSSNGTCFLLSDNNIRLIVNCYSIECEDASDVNSKWPMHASLLVLVIFANTNAYEAHSSVYVSGCSDSEGEADPSGRCR